ncbi:LytR/AlgR family response regulator transcription factor [Aquimarina rhabdastrellae]
MKETKRTAVIVEDSRLARNELKELIKNHNEIEIIGEAENVDEGYDLIITTRPEILFLDINMPGKNGFELLEMLDEVPLVIFTTAYDEYAIKSFEYNAFDYLMKPISAKRFGATIQKVLEKEQEQIVLESDKKNLNSQIFIKEGEHCWLVKIGEISLFEVDGNYTRIYFRDQKPLIYKSLNQIEEKLPEKYFFRINRQQLININEVIEVIPWFNGKLKIKLKNGKEVEVSRRQSSTFKDWLSF